MTKQVTKEILHLNVHDASAIGGLMFGLVLFFLFWIVALYFSAWRYEAKVEEDWFSEMWSKFSIGLLLVLVLFTGYGLFRPASVTQRTEVQTEHFEIVNVKTKGSDTQPLELLVKDEQGNVSVKQIDFNVKDTQVKVSHEAQGYTEKRTRVVYEVTPLYEGVFKKVPEDTVKKEVTLPEKIIKEE
uniref:hypothetical protein n=1 Tax=Lactococcus garvieae TaxID=1363 RepID=UPI00359C4197